MKQNKKGLGRGLSALIPTEDMEFLSQVARGDFAVDLPGLSTQTATSPDKDGKKSVLGLKTIPQEGKAAVTVQKAQKKPDRVNENRRDGRTKVTADHHTLATAENNSAPLTDAASATEVQVHPSPATPAAASVSEEIELNAENGVVWLAPDVIVANPFQPRRHFDAEELSNLASSIREHGILQPIIVRPVGNSTSEEDPRLRRFQLVAGERRWRAAQAANLELLPAIVRAVDDQQALELAVIENVQRHDISPLDAALAYKRLASEFGLSQERIAVRVGKSRSAVANTLRLLDLPEEVQKAINDNLLSEGHGRAILLAEAEGTRRAAFRRILRDKLSVREAEDLARSLNQSSESDNQSSHTSKDLTKTKGAQDANLMDLCDELQRLMGARLAIRGRRKGGQIIIQYSSGEELERIVHLLRDAGKSA